MAVTIKRLHCRVRVNTGQSEVRPNQSGGPHRPLVQYAQPLSEVQAQPEPTPAQKATEQVGHAGERKAHPAGRTDPALVARRVHELMVEEARLSQERGDR
jgi:hypothetical protein